MRLYLKSELSYEQTFRRPLPDLGIFASLDELWRYSRGKEVLDPTFHGVRFRAIIREKERAFWVVGVVGRRGEAYLTVPVMYQTVPTVVEQTQIHWMGDWSAAVQRFAKHFGSSAHPKPLWMAKLLLSDIPLSKTALKLDQLTCDLEVYVTEHARGDRKRFECYNNAKDSIQQFINFASWFEPCLARDFPCQVIQE